MWRLDLRGDLHAPSDRAETKIVAIFLPDPTPLAVGATGNIDEDGNAAASPFAGWGCETSQDGSDACYYAISPGTTVTLTPIDTTARRSSAGASRNARARASARSSSTRSCAASWGRSVPMNLSVIVERSSGEGTVRAGRSTVPHRLRSQL